MANKTKVNLRNDSASPIVFGSLIINPAQSIVIWNTNNSESSAPENFVLVRDNISAFNENIPTGDLVYIVGGVSQPSSFAFEHFAGLIDSYPLIYDQTNFQLQGITSDVSISEQHGGIIFHGSDNYKRLGPGNSGEVLTSQGPGSDVIWLDLGLDGYASDAHVLTHEAGGSDELDGYQITLNYTPSNYNSPVNNLIGEHIAAIDEALAGAAFGDVVGPISSTDEALVRFNGITGKLIQNSNATLTDGGALTLTLGLTTGADINVGGNSITNVNLVDGVDVSDHSSRHENGGADEIEISNLGTSQTNTSLVLKPDGLGGVVWTTDSVNNLDGYVFDTRQIIAGNGLVGGGDLSTDRTFDVVANPDGSIIVNANDIQVGVLATDSQHGNLGGGNLHDLATAFIAGLFSTDGYVKLDGIEDGAQVNTVDSVFGRFGAVIAVVGDYNSDQITNISSVPGITVSDALENLDSFIDGYVPVTRTLTAGAGLTGGGNLNLDRTFDIVANPDGSIIVNANDIQIGTLANDSQHGNLGGGSLHEFADSTQAGFLSIDGYNKLEGIEAGAQVNTVDSVFGRLGNVIALASDYNASQIDNDSSVPGLFVDDALNNLAQDIADVVLDLDGYVPDTRILTAGAGLVGGGDLSTDRTFDIVANPDGSIIVNANDIQVGILATDAQHGNRGGGSLHNLATGSTAGFFSPDGYIKLEGIEDGAEVNVVDSVFGRIGNILAVASDYDASQIDNDSTVPGAFVDDALNNLAQDISDIILDLDGYVPVSRVLTAGAGLVGGGNLSTDRTFDIVANVDGSIIVNANDIQVGILATDTQHGDRGGGSLHELADSTQAGFFSVDGYNKLEGIEDGAQANTVDSVFGRTGVVTALTSDYDASQIDNDSGVPGTFVDDALDYLDGYISGVATDFESHADRHEFGGADQIDGYDLELTYSPTYYATPLNDKLGEHIAAIDEALAGVSNSKKVITVEFTLAEDIFNTTRYFMTWRDAGGDTPGNKRSGSSSGIQNPNTCSPYQVPFDATITKAVLTVRGVGVQNGSVTYPVTYQTDLFEQDFTAESKIADIDFSISNSFTVGTFSVADTNFKGSTNLSIDVNEGDMLGLKFINGVGPSLAGQTRNAFVTLIIEER